MIRTLAALALVLFVVACNTARPPRGEEGAPKAVVFCAMERKGEAEAIAQALNTLYDYDVLLKVTTIRREKSSVAVYGLHDQPQRLEEVTEALKSLGIETGTEAGRMEVLPFQQHATGGNAVVIWLGSTSQSLDASSPATSR